MPGQSSKLDPDTLAKARAAGLDKALVDFPDCVADAARAAALDLADVPAINGTTEPCPSKPWPSMRIRSGR
jgi:citrate lyase beta subunit